MEKSEALPPIITAKKMENKAKNLGKDIENLKKAEERDGSKKKRIGQICLLRG